MNASVNLPMILGATMALAHLNIRREMEGEKIGPLASDLKFSAELALSDCKRIFASERAFDIVNEQLYNEAGELTTRDFVSLGLSAERIVVATIQPEIGDEIEFTQANFNKPQVELKPGRCLKVTFRLQVHPDHDQVAMLASLFKHKVGILLQEPQAELSLAGQGEKAREGDLKSRLDAAEAKAVELVDDGADLDDAP